jgi:hypothetical protein
METYLTTIFEEEPEKVRRRMWYNVGIGAAILGSWAAWALIPIFGLKFPIGLTIVFLGIKRYDDHASGISAYGERKGGLLITEEYLEAREIRIPYREMKDLVIYVDEYLGKPKNLIGIHHGGGNAIEFVHRNSEVSFNFVIKNRQDFERLSRLVARIEANPELRPNLRKL